jgi:Uma2 family endonuclease
MTEEEFLRLPDDGRKYELIDGEIREVLATFEHDTIGANIIARLMPAARGKGVLASSQAGFRMTGGNIRCPDVSFTRKSRLPDGKPNKGFGDAAPDLCVEIISPSEDRKDMQRKIQEYFDAGAEQVWLLFPETREAIVYTSPTESKALAPEDEIDAADILPGFRCAVGDLFDVGL